VMVYMWVVCGSVGCELVAWLHSHMQGLSGLWVVCVHMGGLCVCRV